MAPNVYQIDSPLEGLVYTLVESMFSVWQVFVAYMRMNGVQGTF